MSAAVVNANNGDSNDIIFTIKDTKSYVPLVILSGIDNQKLSKLPSKGFKREVNKYKTKCDNKNTTNEFWYFLQ